MVHFAGLGSSGHAQKQRFMNTLYHGQHLDGGFQLDEGGPPRAIVRASFRFPRPSDPCRLVFLHRAFAKGRASFSATARRCFLRAAFDWLSWLNLPAREAAAFKSGASRLALLPLRGHSAGVRWLFSSVLLGRHPTSSILLLPGCAWRAPNVALSLIRGAGCTDGAGFALCLLRCIQLGAAASVALGEAVSWVLAGHRLCDASFPPAAGPAGASDGTASDGRIKVASSGLLFSPSSVLRAGQVFSLGLCSLLLDQRRHVRLVPLRGSLGTVISFSRCDPKSSSHSRTGVISTAWISARQV